MAPRARTLFALPTQTPRPPRPPRQRWRGRYAGAALLATAAAVATVSIPASGSAMLRPRVADGVPVGTAAAYVCAALAVSALSYVSALVRKDAYAADVDRGWDPERHLDAAIGIPLQLAAAPMLVAPTSPPLLDLIGLALFAALFGGAGAVSDALAAAPAPSDAALPAVGSREDALRLAVAMRAVQRRRAICTCSLSLVARMLPLYVGAVAACGALLQLARLCLPDARTDPLLLHAAVLSAAYTLLPYAAALCGRAAGAYARLNGRLRLLLLASRLAWAAQLSLTAAAGAS